MRDSDKLSAWLREAADEIDAAHVLLDAHRVERTVSEDGTECTLAARIAVALHDDTTRELPAYIGEAGPDTVRFIKEATEEVERLRAENKHLRGELAYLVDGDTGPGGADAS